MLNWISIYFLNHFVFFIRLEAYEQKFSFSIFDVLNSARPYLMCLDLWGDVLEVHRGCVGDISWMLWDETGREKNDCTSHKEAINQ